MPRGEELKGTGVMENPNLRWVKATKLGLETFKPWIERNDKNVAFMPRSIII